MGLGTVVEAIQVVPQGVHAVGPMEDAIGVEDGDYEEDEVLTQDLGSPIPGE